VLLVVFIYILYVFGIIEVTYYKSNLYIIDIKF
jgi:hypothetical protein